jgi:hypothetical protein
MGHLALVTPTAAPIRTSRTDTRLLKICRQYLLLLQHQASLREKHATAQAVAAQVLRDRPEDPLASALWVRLWDATTAAALSRGVAHNERRLAELLTEIAETPAKTEAGLRARLQVWRTVLAADDADRLLDGIVADFTRKRRG